MLSSLGAQAVRQSNTRNIIDTSFLLFIIDFSIFYFNTQKKHFEKEVLVFTTNSDKRIPCLSYF
jgi:hypothetical protein